MVDLHNPVSFSIRNRARQKHSLKDLLKKTVASSSNTNTTTTTTATTTATTTITITGEKSSKKCCSFLPCSPTDITPASVMTTGLVSVHPRSAFSDSGSVSRRPTDKSFLKRLFNRSKPRAPTTIASNPSTPTAFDFPRKMSASGSTIVTMSPSPHTHPLLSKPFARDELRPRTPLTKYSHLDGTISTGGEGFIHSRKMAALTVVGGKLVDNGFNHSFERELYTRSLRDREKAAMSAAVESKYVQEWGFFIKCYSEGRFNLSNPPDPPPRRPGFDHLTAPVPPNEKQRLEAVKACNVSLPMNANDKYHRLVLLAKKVFQTRMAAISFIDSDREIFKAEHAFGRDYVDRSKSIGAHVLLSNEPMVILDTAKDWRLKGNPLVKEAPHIRFYAGAPIVTYDGHTIGTFSVFDTQPRDSFTVASRRKLMDFARLSMTEVELVMEEHDMLSRCTSNTTLQRPMSKENDAQSITSGPTGHNVKKTASPPTSSPPSPRRLKTPKTMSKRDATTPINRPLPIRSNIPPAINIPRESDDGRQSRTSTRVSDMPTPPHTPSRPFSISTTASLSFGHTFNPTAAPPNSLAATRSPSPEEITTVVQTQIQSKRRPPPIHTPGPREVPLQVPFSPGPITSMAEASFATSIIARSLNYDLVYLLRVSPIRRPEIKLYEDQTMTPVDNMYTKILVAHGLPDPLPTFDANLHLRALRSVGGLVYQNPAKSAEDDDVGFRLGILLPLLRDGSEPVDEGYCSVTTINGGIQGGADTCTGGIVLAAFTRKEDKDASQPFTADEVRCLREFGEAMKDILLRVDRNF